MNNLKSLSQIEKENKIIVQRPDENKKYKEAYLKLKKKEQKFEEA